MYLFAGSKSDVISDLSTGFSCSLLEDVRRIPCLFEYYCLTESVCLFFFFFFAVSLSAEKTRIKPRQAPMI